MHGDLGIRMPGAGKLGYSQRKPGGGGGSTTPRSKSALAGRHQKSAGDGGTVRERPARFVHAGGRERELAGGENMGSGVGRK